MKAISYKYDYPDDDDCFERVQLRHRRLIQFIGQTLLRCFKHHEMVLREMI